MANKEHITILEQGADVWNNWRAENPDVMPDLRGANLKEKKLSDYDFADADIRGTNFRAAELEGAKFINVKAGVRFSSLLLNYLISLFFSALSGLLSFFGGVILLAVTIRDGSVFNVKDEFSQIIIVTSLSIFLVCTMIVAIRHRQFYSVAVAVTVTGALAVTGAGAGEGAVASAFTVTMGMAIALAVAVTGAVPLTGEIPFAVAGPAAGAGAACFIILSLYIAWRTLKEDEQFAGLRRFGLSFSSWGGTNFKSASLRGADFTDALLKSTRFDKKTDLINVCWKDARKPELARFTGTILENHFVRELLVTGKAETNSFAGVSLKGAYLADISLDDTDFTEADLSNAILENATLRNANLTKVQALGVRFRGADLTGACLEAWNIDSTTQLEGAHADYVYLLGNHQERRPNSGTFGESEFSKLFQEVLDTVDLIFKNGIDWQAFMITFDKLRERIRVESEDAEVTVQSIENKGDGVFVVKVNVPPSTDKSEVHSEFTQEYDKQLGLIEEKYELRLEHKEEVIDIYRKQSAALEKIIEREAQRPINIRTEAKGGNMGDTITINAKGDVAFAKDQAIANISKQISDSANLADDLADKLNKLTQAVNAMARDMPDDKANEVTGDLQTLVDEAEKDEPRKKWYQLSGEGLIEAAQAVGSLGKPVIDATNAVLKLMG